MTGLVIHAPPGALRQWSAGDYTWLATQDALWRLGEQDGLWPLPHVTELATRGPDALALSWGRRQRVGAATSGALLRHGLDSTAEWRDGWVLDGAVMPAGARWAPDLAPLVRGHGATWSTFGQRFRLRDGRVEAIRSHPDAWDTPLTCDPDEEVATTASGSRLWGPGRCVWDLDTGVATSLDDWADGVAASEGQVAVAVDSLTGEGLWLNEHVVTAHFRVRLRNDVVETLTLDDGVATLTTALGRRYTVHGEQVDATPGRHAAVRPEPTVDPVFAIVLDGIVTHAGRRWGYRRDGALISSPA